MDLNLMVKIRLKLSFCYAFHLYENTKNAKQNLSDKLKFSFHEL